MNSAPNPQAVVFDLDGLMFNTEELYQDVGAEMLRRRGHEFGPDLLDAMMGRPNRVALQIMIDWHDLAATVEDLTRETAEIFPPILDTRLTPMPGLLELLAALEQHGIPKAIATSSGKRFVDDVLSRFALAPRFDFILTAESVTEGKPHPEVYQKAAAGFHLTPPQMAVLEDSANGCRAAVAAGARVVAVPGGHSAQHDFTGAEFIAQTLGDPRIYTLLGLGQPETGRSS
ncbi:MAG TPA: HAD family phosphatase [Pirellulales bacterium]|jgi:HAD superfamily hydrolase (TIGR01509 family)